jgi:hypothetical protein
MESIFDILIVSSLSQGSDTPALGLFYVKGVKAAVGPNDDLDVRPSLSQSPDQKFKQGPAVTHIEIRISSKDHSWASRRAHNLHSSRNPE